MDLTFGFLESEGQVTFDLKVKRSKVKSEKLCLFWEENGKKHESWLFFDM